MTAEAIIARARARLEPGRYVAVDFATTADLIQEIQALVSENERLLRIAERVQKNKALSRDSYIT